MRLIAAPTASAPKRSHRVVTVVECFSAYAVQRGRRKHRARAASSSSSSHTNNDGSASDAATLRHALALPSRWIAYGPFRGGGGAGGEHAGSAGSQKVHSGPRKPR